MEETVEGRLLAVRRLGLVQHAVDAMVARRGRPGSDVHAELRAAQAAMVHAGQRGLLQVAVASAS
ncbi:MAG: hypothetical protein WD232_03405 [Acidimicrobiales bacterium]